MLIVLHICSLLIKYDSGYTSPGDSETLVSYIISNIWSERRIVTSLGKFEL